MIPDPTTRSCLTADEAFAELGIDRTTGYRAIQEGTFPVPIIRVGRLIRVPTAPLRRLLDPLLGDADHEGLYDGAFTTERPAGPTLKLVPRPDLAHDECSEVE
jgi:predicted DNA-binding transcriptional regulator AlpA